MKVLISVLVAVLIPIAGSAADWPGCSSDVDRINRMAREIRSLADQLSSLDSDVESASDEIDSCDDTSDCQRARDEFRRRKSEFQSYAAQLVSEAQSLLSRAKAVQSCAGGTSGSGLCDVYRSYRGEVSDAALIKLCKDSMSEADCKKCLGVK